MDDWSQLIANAADFGFGAQTRSSDVQRNDPEARALAEKLCSVYMDMGSSHLALHFAELLDGTLRRYCD
jgi:hypothetical protein